ncbi:MAG: integrase catalytic subunit [Candidatus Peregrinibacteria bacterium GW2011_GWC2_39_14]|nr:MAG: Integrase catalytic region [Candidatus Peregrinibacteria bacterium GW2011_GWA2_38_36]KKR06882.1 MAG: integrase catalytic subunit [Candidatus Peregrinibacteria bacterium GW2011_GWC2_39_14]
MQYTHISIEEREKIQEMLWQKKSVRQIAKALNRSPSSISREIFRNQSRLKQLYRPRIAQDRADMHKKYRGREKRLKNEIIRSYVISKLRERWSPEQISGRLRIDHPEQAISHEAIYQYVYAQIHRDGYGYLRPECEDLRIYLRRRRKRRVHKGYRKCSRTSLIRGRSINVRPAVVNERIRVGDWEGDSVASVSNKTGINTLVERKIGYLMMTKLKNKTGKATTNVVSKRLSILPEKLRLTLTLDNGPENQDWQTIEERIRITCYHANPYHSWERGTNENTNSLIRQYFPKKTDFGMISDEQIKRVETFLNNRPRKRLNYKTPLEAMSVALES